MQINWKEKVVVITGGSRGLGKVLAAGLLEAGAKVVAVGSKDCDVTKEEEVHALAEKVVIDHERIDIWINNAGLWLPPTPIEEIEMSKAKSLFEVNVIGTMHGVKAASKVMKKQGNGTIVNIISTTAFDGMNGSSGSVYVTSKYALRGLTNVLREELKGNNIKVIGVYPGGFKSDLFNEAIPKNFSDFMEPEYVAEKIIENLNQPKPELELIIARPGQKLSYELECLKAKNK